MSSNSKEKYRWGFCIAMWLGANNWVITITNKPNIHRNKGILWIRWNKLGVVYYGLKQWLAIIIDESHDKPILQHKSAQAHLAKVVDILQRLLTCFDTWRDWPEPEVVTRNLKKLSIRIRTTSTRHCLAWEIIILWSLGSQWFLEFPKNNDGGKVLYVILPKQASSKLIV